MWERTVIVVLKVGNHHVVGIDKKLKMTVHPRKS